MQMMQDVDFRFVFVGIESPENDILKSTRKMLNVNKDIVETVRKINSYGMIVNGGFIIGFDSENSRSADFLGKIVQDSGISMAMVGKLYALPNTQLTKRLQREGRLLEEDSILKNADTDVDQTTSGLNFVTVRPRIEVLNDYLRVIEKIYDPKNYYERVILTGLNLRPDNKYKPNLRALLKSLKSLLILSGKIGLNRATGWQFIKMLATIIRKNPKAIEAVVNLAAMFIHFQKHSKFVIELTQKEINTLRHRIGNKNHVPIKSEELESCLCSNEFVAAESK
jgi:hypothetical protein